MKPIVVSAAAAVRAPSAVPSVSAALPCNRRRREMLLKSIDYSPWRVIPAPTLLAQPVCGARFAFARFVPECRGFYLSVLIGENRGSENRAISALTKMAADFVNCMRES